MTNENKIERIRRMLNNDEHIYHEECPMCGYNSLNMIPSQVIYSIARIGSKKVHCFMCGWEFP